ncbi:MAG: hypothetical protein GWP10_17810 [Nitrospiraceae bacterium]|nr:hypothetical protein [Nitrospiraceae bacterium]
MTIKLAPLRYIVFDHWVIIPCPSYLLKTLDVRYLSEGTSVGTLNRNYIHNLSIAIPPSHEQHSIAAYLDRETARIDALIEKVRKSIDLLREYRTALISATVTGKIDVRGSIELRTKKI